MAKLYKLGDAQRAVLRSLASHNGGNWYPGCGWYWATRSVTIKVLDSLIKHGLVEKKLERDIPRYTITDAGRAFIGV